MTSVTDEKCNKLTVACQLLSAYLARSPENKIHELEWQVVKVACEYLAQHLKT